MSGFEIGHAMFRIARSLWYRFKPHPIVNDVRPPDDEWPPYLEISNCWELRVTCSPSPFGGHLPDCEIYAKITGDKFNAIAKLMWRRDWLSTSSSSSLTMGLHCSVPFVVKYATGQYQIQDKVWHEQVRRASDPLTHPDAILLASGSSYVAKLIVYSNGQRFELRDKFWITCPSDGQPETKFHVAKIEDREMRPEEQSMTKHSRRIPASQRPQIEPPNHSPQVPS